MKPQMSANRIVTLSCASANGVSAARGGQAVPATFLRMKLGPGLQGGDVVHDVVNRADAVLAAAIGWGLPAYDERRQSGEGAAHSAETDAGCMGDQDEARRVGPPGVEVAWRRGRMERPGLERGLWRSTSEGVKLHWEPSARAEVRSARVTVWDGVER